jgi:hypothetical protein
MADRDDMLENRNFIEIIGRGENAVTVGPSGRYDLIRLACTLIRHFDNWRTHIDGAMRGIRCTDRTVTADRLFDFLSRTQTGYRGSARILNASLSPIFPKNEPQQTQLIACFPFMCRVSGRRDVTKSAPGDCVPSNSGAKKLEKRAQQRLSY